MNRPWQIWLIFALCAGLAVAALAWLTTEAVRADLDRTRSSKQAELEQHVSLVLWRMDTKLAPLIAEEVARPPSFYQRSAQLNSFSNSQNGLGDKLANLSLTLPDNVLLNYSCAADVGCQSPQVPDESMESILAGYGVSTEQLQLRRRRLEQLASQVSVDELLEQLPAQLPTTEDLREQVSSEENLFAGNTAIQRQLDEPLAKGKAIDLQQRAQRYQDVAQQEFRKQRTAYASAPQASQPSAVEPVIEGVSRPIWVGDNLLLARRVVVDGKTVVQGSWLDWPGIREDLLAEAKDLLPQASLSPVHDTSQADPTRMLAGLPVLLNPGEKLITLKISEPMRWALWIGWAALLASLLSAAVLLFGVVALSERRAAFVSSVTHELRTPLTTFRMYADMLARGMVPDAQRRQQYLETLRAEAQRLTHLVENVLSYARLERGRGVNRHECVTVDQLVERLQGRLTERAEQAEMQLQVEVTDGTGLCELTTDVGVVEQILFNLVDNAAKYAHQATDRRIHWEAHTVNGNAELTIRDHGPGFGKPGGAKRSRAFSKTAEEAAVTAPGVGLGLALCRRLAKQLGGRLQIDDSREGVTAVLRLPLNTATGV